MLRSRRHDPIEQITLARTLGARPLYAVHIYRLGELLIDTGPPATVRDLVRFLAADPPRTLVVTHHHEDHAGGASELAAAFGLTVHAPAAGVRRLERPAWLPPYRRVVWGQPRPATARPLGPKVEAGGRVLRVVPTPGHADDHVCLFEEREGWLFSADLYIAPRFGYFRAVEDLGAWLASLRACLALGPRLMMCAHAGFVAEPCRALTAKIEQVERLAGQARGLAAAGLGERAITRRLLGREGPMTFFSLGEFSRLNLTRALLSL